MGNRLKRDGLLVFIGLGLNDENGVSLAGMDEIRSSDIVFAESYTSVLAEGSWKRLSEATGKTIQVLDRSAVEDAMQILEACKSRKVSVLVPGDPMSATTHVDLRLRAEMMNLETRVIHGASVLTAVPGALGLQHYKFGRTTTLPFPAEGYSPTSPYEVIRENLERGLHTLVLLDIDAESGRYMSANEGIHLLRDLERRVASGILAEDSIICVVARVGSEDSAVRAGRMADLEGLDFGRPPHTLVVPGKLHFMELEALQILAGLPEQKA